MHRSVGPPISTGGEGREGDDGSTDSAACLPPVRTGAIIPSPPERHQFSVDVEPAGRGG